MTTTMTADPTDFLKRRAQALGLYGLLAHWEALAQQEWLPAVIEYEESERKRRSLQRCARNAKLGRFKLKADFDWRWPQEIDRSLIEHSLAIPAMHRDGFLRFLCPLCREFNSAVNPNTNLARCFHCARNFNTIEMVMTVRQCGFLDALRFLDHLDQPPNNTRAHAYLRRIDALLHRR